MAEVIGITSRLVALATFAFESTESLHQSVKSFRSNKRLVRELTEELKSLSKALHSLQHTTVQTSPNLQSLKRVLLRCGHACEEFKEMLIKYAAHSEGSRTSFQEWDKLRYMGGDIAAFKNTLAVYESTIRIALGYENFRTSAVTTDTVNEYKRMIKNTTLNLEQHLQDIESKLQQENSISDEDAITRLQMEEERESAIQCLAICARVSDQVNLLRREVFENFSAPKETVQIGVSTLRESPPVTPVSATDAEISDEKLANIASKLRQRIAEIDNKLKAPSTASGLEEAMHERNRYEQEKNSIQECLAIWHQVSRRATKARTNIFEDVSAGEGAHQLIITTLEDLLSAKRVTADIGAVQWLGRISDASLQQLSRDRCVESGNLTGPERGLEKNSQTKYVSRYGAGNYLS